MAITTSCTMYPLRSICLRLCLLMCVLTLVLPELPRADAKHHQGHQSKNNDEGEEVNYKPVKKHNKHHAVAKLHKKHYKNNKEVGFTSTSSSSSSSSDSSHEHHHKHKHDKDHGPGASLPAKVKGPINWMKECMNGMASLFMSPVSGKKSPLSPLDVLRKIADPFGLLGARPAIGRPGKKHGKKTVMDGLVHMSKEGGSFLTSLPQMMTQLLQSIFQMFVKNTTGGFASFLENILNIPKLWGSLLDGAAGKHGRHKRHAKHSSASDTSSSPSKSSSEEMSSGGMMSRIMNLPPIKVAAWMFLGRPLKGKYGDDLEKAIVAVPFFGQIYQAFASIVKSIPGANIPYIVTKWMLNTVYPALVTFRNILLMPLKIGGSFFG